MKKRGFLAMGLMVLVVFFISLSAWAVPQLINYQGKLTDPAGNPVEDGSYGMTFYLSDAPTLGSKLWEEGQTVTITDGIYNVLLGSVTPFPEGLFDNDELYLQVKVEGEALTPRQRITSTAYAMKAGDADTLDGLDSMDFTSAATDYGRIGVASDLYEDTTRLHDKYVNQDGDTMTRRLDVYETDPLGIGEVAIWGHMDGVAGVGVFGTSNGGSDAWAVAGRATESGKGVYGVSQSGEGMYGVHSDSGNRGILGGNWYGAYGQYKSTGNYGVLGHKDSGVLGKGIGTGSAAVLADGDLYVTGAYRGNIGNGGAPFPRPAYDSGWVNIYCAPSDLALVHGIGGNVDDYVVDMTFLDADWGRTNEGIGGFWYGGDDYLVAGVFWYDLTNNEIKVRRRQDDTCDDTKKVRVRIWVVQ